MEPLKSDLKVFAEPGFWITLVLVGAGGAVFWLIGAWSLMHV